MNKKKDKKTTKKPEEEKGKNSEESKSPEKKTAPKEEAAKSQKDTENPKKGAKPKEEKSKPTTSQKSQSPKKKIASSKSNKDLQNSVNSEKDDLLPCKAKITGFGKKEDITEILNTFLTNNQLGADSFKDEGNDKEIVYSFQDSKLCIDFIKELNIQKVTNKKLNLNKLKTVIDFKFASRSHKDKLKEKKEDKPKTRKQNPFRSYVTERTPINISDPYVDPIRKEQKEYEESKKKWIDKKGFHVYNNADRNERLTSLGTCVARDPTDSNPLTFQFRDFDKGSFMKPLPSVKKSRAKSSGHKKKQETSTIKEEKEEKSPKKEVDKQKKEKTSQKKPGQKEEKKKEEPKKEEPKKDEPKKEETKKEEAPPKKEPAKKKGKKGK